MVTSSCFIQITNRPGNSIYFTTPLMNKFSIEDEEELELVFGNRTVRTYVKRAKGRREVCYIPRSLAEELTIPARSKGVWMTKEGNQLRLAPIFGILTTAMVRTRLKPFGTRTKMFEGFLRSAGQEAFYFAFTPDDIDWEDQTIHGSFLVKGPSGYRWEKRVTPFPNVVYNRVPNRAVEESEKVKTAKRGLMSQGVKMFNPSFFNKWEVYQMLHDHPKAAAHMPETHYSPAHYVVSDMLKRYPFVYIKPSGGSLGLGIFKLWKHPSEGYLIQYRNGNENVLKRTYSFPKLMDFIEKQNRKKSGYIIQQGIDLVSIDGRQLDFRVHLTKDRRNQWEVVGIGAKIAGKGSVTTHVRTGGVVTTPEQALRQVFGPKADEMLRTMKSTSILLAESMEEINPGLLGEIGFDIGIDRDGNVWMFEANSKPGFSIFKHPSLKKSYQRSMRNIYEHSLFLADQQMKQQEG